MFSYGDGWGYSEVGIACRYRPQWAKTPLEPGIFLGRSTKVSEPLRLSPCANIGRITADDLAIAPAGRGSTQGCEAQCLQNLFGRTGVIGFGLDSTQAPSPVINMDDVKMRPSSIRTFLSEEPKSLTFKSCRLTDQRR
jgi:hypothetical protein